ncbi:MAG: 2Fe-2S iron-sulfur cluster binding domain-containing protein [Comamonadaceae bacterium]|nr:MAG: 2Fe-2S iron-sulfur cluster binding domain-containing protein [Comamonadaceae bacterium]
MDKAAHPQYPNQAQAQAQTQTQAQVQPHFTARISGARGIAGAPFTAPAGDTLLHAALAAGHELPNSCRNGTCRSCICQLESGAVTYRIEWPGLSREEKSEGWILPCVAYPVSDVVMAMPT